MLGQDDASRAASTRKVPDCVLTSRPKGFNGSATHLGGCSLANIEQASTRGVEERKEGEDRDM